MFDGSPLTEELFDLFTVKGRVRGRFVSKRHKPLLILLSHRSHSATAGGWAFLPGMAEDQELTQPHKAQLESSLQQRTSNTYRSAEHSQALLSGLVSLRDSSILFDVVLVVEEKPIEAHRILLAASCDYFRYISNIAAISMCLSATQNCNIQIFCGSTLSILLPDIKLDP